jgi:hypothetical protein
MLNPNANPVAKVETADATTAEVVETAGVMTAIVAIAIAAETGITTDVTNANKNQTSSYKRETYCSFPFFIK